MACSSIKTGKISWKGQMKQIAQSRIFQLYRPFYHVSGQNET